MLFVNNFLLNLNRFLTLMKGRVYLHIKRIKEDITIKKHIKTLLIYIYLTDDLHLFKRFQSLLINSLYCGT